MYTIHIRDMTRLQPRLPQGNALKESAPPERSAEHGHLMAVSCAASPVQGPTASAVPRRLGGNVVVDNAPLLTHAHHVPRHGAYWPLSPRSYPGSRRARSSRVDVRRRVAAVADTMVAVMMQACSYLDAAFSARTEPDARSGHGAAAWAMTRCGRASTLEQRSVAVPVPTPLTQRRVLRARGTRREVGRCGVVVARSRLNCRHDGQQRRLGSRERAARAYGELRKRWAALTMLASAYGRTHHTRGSAWSRVPTESRAHEQAFRQVRCFVRADRAMHLKTRQPPNSATVKVAMPTCNVRWCDQKR
jgi:hypothetical protein